MKRILESVFAALAFLSFISTIVVASAIEKDIRVGVIFTVITLALGVTFTACWKVFYDLNTIRYKRTYYTHIYGGGDYTMKALKAKYAHLFKSEEEFKEFVDKYFTKTVIHYEKHI